MKTRRTGYTLWLGNSCFIAFWLGASVCWGGISQPLYVGNLIPIRDEFNQPMKGAIDPQAAASRYLVEIRTTKDGIIRPPFTNGTAHPYNPLLTANSTGGFGENAKASDSGMFCLVFPVRPVAGTKIFARVYDAPTAAEADFYADSSLVVVPTNGVSVALSFGALQPLDAGDDDADGLNNSWERALGTYSRPAVDFDGDGMSDLNEMLAGTDPADAASLLAFQVAWPTQPEDAHVLHIRWPAVPGKSYQIETAAMLAPDPVTGEIPLFQPLGEVLTAGADETSLEVWVDISGDDVKRVYRIKIAETGLP